MVINTYYKDITYRIKGERAHPLYAVLKKYVDSRRYSIDLVPDRFVHYAVWEIGDIMADAYGLGYCHDYNPKTGLPEGKPMDYHYVEYLHADDFELDDENELIIRIHSHQGFVGYGLLGFLLKAFPGIDISVNVDELEAIQSDSEKHYELKILRQDFELSKWQFVGTPEGECRDWENLEWNELGKTDQDEDDLPF